MRKTIAVLLMALTLVFGGAACDDNSNDGSGVDEDDSRLGPGDGEDETGPGR